MDTCFQAVQVPALSPLVSCVTGGHTSIPVVQDTDAEKEHGTCKALRSIGNVQFQGVQRDVEQRKQKIDAANTVAVFDTDWANKMQQQMEKMLQDLQKGLEKMQQNLQKGLEKMQQNLQKGLEKMQQNLQQTLQQQLEKMKQNMKYHWQANIEKMHHRLANNDARSFNRMFVRSTNSSIQEVPRKSDGKIPNNIGYPRTLAAMNRIRVKQANALIAFYGLEVGGNISVKRKRIKDCIGIRDTNH